MFIRGMYFDKNDATGGSSDDNDDNTELNTDDEILNNIPGISDDDPEIEIDETGAIREKGNKDQEKTTPAKGEKAAAKPASKDGTKQPVDPNAGKRNPGDLVDRTGTVIAKAGPERRYFENWKKADQKAITLTQENRTLTSQLAAYKESNTIGTQLGLQPQDMTVAAKLLSSLRKDPVKTVKDLLTQVKAAGHTIDDIGAGVDTASIEQVIAKYLGPIAEQRQANEAKQASDRQAQTQLDEFTANYPDSDIHLDTIGALLEKDESGTLTLNEAYLKLKLFYREKGLDFSVPLQQYSKQRPQVTKPNNRKPIPNGRTPVDDDLTDRETVAGVDTSYGDIIRDAMSDAGYRNQ